MSQNTQMDLYMAIKYNNVHKARVILKNFDLVKNEFLDDKITFVSLAVLGSIIHDF